MVKGSNSAVPATPTRTGGIRGEDSATTRTSRRKATADHSVSFEDSVDGSDTNDDDVNDYGEMEEKVQESSTGVLDLPDNDVLAVTRSSGPRSLSRNLADDFADMMGPEPAYDYDNATEDSGSSDKQTKPDQPATNRPPLIGDTPSANKMLGRCLELMESSSEWVQLFGPTAARQAACTDLDAELAWPVNSTSTRQVADDTVSLLKAMGVETTAYPSSIALSDWTASAAGAELQKWKKKLRNAFGVAIKGSKRPPIARQAGEVVDPTTIPLPKTPKKTTRKGVFSTSGNETPYFQDSHMVTPRSESRKERMKEDQDNSYATEPTKRGSARRTKRQVNADDESSDDGRDLLHFDGDDDDQTAEFSHQMRLVSELASSNVTPRIDITTHRPLTNIVPYSGHRNKCDNSMQWLRASVYEMKGTHTPPNEWCMAFELSLRDDALHWHRQLLKKTKRQWKRLYQAFIKNYCSQFTQSARSRYYTDKRSDKEHICDYMNRLNGYARNAGIKFEVGGREAKDHVQRFLEMWGDKSIERRLCHMQVKDIHLLEDMIMDILKAEDKSSARDSSQIPPKDRDSGRRRDDRRGDRRNDYSRDSHYRRERHHNDRYRDDSRQRPRVTLVETLTDAIAEYHDNDNSGPFDEGSRGQQRDVDKVDDYDDERYVNEDYDDDYESADEERQLAAANEHERRAAAEGPRSRPDGRPYRGDNGNRDNRDSTRPIQRFSQGGQNNCDGRPRYGPCAVCGGASHSAQYCYRCCKLCKQMHDAGKYEAFQEITNLLTAKVDKTELSPELQNLIFSALL